MSTGIRIDQASTSASRLMSRSQRGRQELPRFLWILFGFCIELSLSEYYSMGFATRTRRAELEFLRL